MSVLLFDIFSGKFEGDIDGVNPRFGLQVERKHAFNECELFISFILVAG